MTPEQEIAKRQARFEKALAIANLTMQVAKDISEASKIVYPSKRILRANSRTPKNRRVKAAAKLMIFMKMRKAQIDLHGIVSMPTYASGAYPSGGVGTFGNETFNGIGEAVFAPRK